MRAKKRDTNERKMLTISGITEEQIAELRRRALENNRSLSGELRDIIAAALKEAA